MKKSVILISVAIVTLVTILILCNLPKPIASLHINSGTVRLESDMSKQLSVTVKPENARQYKLVSEDEFVAVCEGNNVCAANEGETYVYAASKNGKIKSNRIKVIVSNNIFEIASYILSEDDTSQEEPEITDEKINLITDGTVAKVSVSAISKESANEPTPPVEGDASDIVYITASGSKFHKSTCSYAKTASPVPRSEAISEGKTPCKKCNP